VGGRRPDGSARLRSGWKELSRCLQGWEVAKKNLDGTLWRREDLVID
jgi:hypothetical protein